MTLSAVVFLLMTLITDLSIIVTSSYTLTWSTETGSVSMVLPPSAGNGTSGFRKGSWIFCGASSLAVLFVASCCALLFNGLLVISTLSTRCETSELAFSGQFCISYSINSPSIDPSPFFPRSRFYKIFQISIGLLMCCSSIAILCLFSKSRKNDFNDCAVSAAVIGAFSSCFHMAAALTCTRALKESSMVNAQHFSSAVHTISQEY